MSVWEVVYLLLGTLGLGLLERRLLEKRLLPLLAAGAWMSLLAWPIGLSAGSTWAIMRLWAWACFVWLPLWLLRRAWLDRDEPRRRNAQGAVALVSVALGVQCFLVEPHWLETTHHTITSDRLTQAYTVVVLADVQTDDPGSWERRVLEAAMAEEPDLIVFPGDFVQEWGEAREPARAALRALLVEVGLQAPLGVFAVGGNVELRQDDWPTLFDGTSVTPWTAPTTVALAEDLTLTGLPMEQAFDTRLHIDRIAPFHIVFGHGPDFALGEVQADLLIAGHTHGGQVQLPGLGPILTLSAVPRAWAAGVTTLPDGSHLAVSRGIGMERGDAPRLRFLCRPELMVLHLEPRF